MTTATATEARRRFYLVMDELAGHHSCVIC